MVAGGQEGGHRTHEPGPVHSCNTGQMPLTQFLIAVTIAAVISMATFAHADRNGSTHATAWGVGAFLAAGVVVPVYFVRFWLRKRRPSV
jgi:hypothetical protein